MSLNTRMIISELVIIGLCFNHIVQACSPEAEYISNLTENALSGSSFHSAGLHFYFCKLNAKQRAWAAKYNNDSQYIDADLGYVRKLVAVATQGRSNYAQWVTSYYLAYSETEGNFQYILDANGENHTFVANTDRNTIVNHTFDSPIIARYVRLNPQTWSGHISIRWGVYGCYYDLCNSYPCENGNCTSDGRTTTCHCNPGFTGDKCETDIDECSSSPCSNNTKSCQDEINQYHCDCLAGYSGIHCESDIDECESNPCSNNSVLCQNLINSYTCKCHEGYFGVNCETEQDVINRSEFLSGVQRQDLVIALAVGAIGATICAILVIVLAFFDVKDRRRVKTRRHQMYERNPCSTDNVREEGYYFAHSDESKFVQCHDHGGCFVMPCAPGTTWNDDIKACGHASGGDTDDGSSDEAIIEKEYLLFNA